MTTPYKDVTTKASTSTSTLTAPKDSLEPRTSTSTTLCEQQQASKPPQQAEAGKKLETPTRYLYTERVAPPNPDYQRKPPSKLSKFMSKFQSPAVKATKSKKKQEEDEEKRTGVKTYTAIGAPQGSGQWTADAIGNV